MQYILFASEKKTFFSSYQCCIWQLLYGTKANDCYDGNDLKKERKEA